MKMESFGVLTIWNFEMFMGDDMMWLVQQLYSSVVTDIVGSKR